MLFWPVLLLLFGWISSSVHSTAAAAAATTATMTRASTAAAAAAAVDIAIYVTADCTAEQHFAASTEQTISISRRCCSGTDGGEMAVMCHRVDDIRIDSSALRTQSVLQSAIKRAFAHVDGTVQCIATPITLHCCADVSHRLAAPLVH